MLVPACVEVPVISLFGYLLRISSMMGGMRNSPEEDLVLQTQTSVFTAALCGVPGFLLIGAFLIQRSNHSLRPFPKTSPVRVP